MNKLSRESAEHTTRCSGSAQNCERKNKKVLDKRYKMMYNQ